MHVSKLVLAATPNSLNSVCVYRWVVGVHKVDGVVHRLMILQLVVCCPHVRHYACTQKHVLTNDGQ